MNELRVAYVAIARSTFDVPFAAEIAATAFTQLQAAGLNIIGSSALVLDQTSAERVTEDWSDKLIDLLVILQATFADSSMVMTMARELDVPLLLWAVPEPHTGGRLRLNSLCGINLAGHALTRSKCKYGYMYARPDDGTAIEKVIRYARAGRVRRMLRSARVGRIGENPQGFESCLYDATGLKQRFGLDVVNFDLEQDLFESVRAVAGEPIQAVRDRLNRCLVNLEEMDTQATDGTLSTYVALRTIAENRKLDSFAIRCWPEFFTKLGCAACGAMSLLSDEMTPCSCEADVNGTVTQMILQWLSGEPAFGTDLVSVNEEMDAIVLWHCGLAPPSMADPSTPIQATIHSNRQLPLLMEFPLKPGRVTVARLSEASRDYRLVVGSGEILQAPPSFSGTTGTLRFDRSVHEVMDMILGEGLEHHVSLCYGDHVPSLHAFAKLLDLPILSLT
ncbi:MAG: fucose isomerase [Chloroflexi bacterium]|nr:fucose isomerase [Chloroflexota bacterium]